MTNPLFPNSKSTDIKAAYEQAAFMDDSTTMQKEKAQSIAKNSKHIATAQSEASQGRIVGTVFGVLIGLIAMPILLLFNPIIGGIYIIGFIYLISKK